MEVDSWAKITEEAMESEGNRLSVMSQYDGKVILAIAIYGLIDANYHTVAKELEGILSKLVTEHRETVAEWTKKYNAGA